MDDRERERHEMVERQLVARGISDARVLAAMRAVPREQFVTPGHEALAYRDRPLPILEGQTISQPYIVAIMAEEAAIGENDRVLEVGAGSGYAAAVLSKLAEQVFAIERHRKLFESAKRTLAGLGYDNIQLRYGDGSKGWPEKAPFDAILVAAAAPVQPTPLREQLAIGGRLVIPIGISSIGQRLMRITRTTSERYEEHDLGSVNFVPLVGNDET